MNFTQAMRFLIETGLYSVLSAGVGQITMKDSLSNRAIGTMTPSEAIAFAESKGASK